MRRVDLFLNDSSVRGKRCALPENTENLLDWVNKELGINAAIIYTSVGSTIDYSVLVRDGDALYAAQAEEPFLGGISTNVNESVRARLSKSENDVNFHSCGVPNENTDSVRSGTPYGTRNDWVSFNVGGKLFVTTKTTILHGEPNSMLARLLEDDIWQSTSDCNGTIMLDRSPRYFEPLLNFLRHGEMLLDEGLNPRGVLAEAEFFGMSLAVNILEQMCKDRHVDAPINRHSFVDKLMTIKSSDSLRCRGLNFQGTDLSRLDLSKINFDLCDLRDCNFAKCNLSGCSFQRAVLEGAILDGADIAGTKFGAAEMRGASLRCCVLGQRNCGPRMSSADMRDVDFDESDLTGACMRNSVCPS
eukprot:CFRG4272T1